MAGITDKKTETKRGQTIPLPLAGYDLKNSNLSIKQIYGLIEMRNEYRIEGRFVEADDIRQQLLDIGIKLIDLG